MFTDLTVVSIDDNQLNLMLIESMLKGMDISIKSFSDPADALEYCAENSVDLILTDYMMPEIDGISLIKYVRSYDESIPIVMITAMEDDDSIKIQALESGATDFLHKPLKTFEFKARINNLLTMRKNQLLIEDRALHLQKEVNSATSKIVEREFETISILGRASEFKDAETGNHIQRVAYYSKALAEDIYNNEEITEGIFFSSPLHDVGKLGIPDAILTKPGKLTPEEFDIIKKHTLIGHDMLQGAESKYIKYGARIALSHHERWDGKGYPYGIAGEDIPRCGRIVAVSDVFDALMSERPYKKAWSFEDTSAYIIENRGTMFSPEVVDSFKNLQKEFLNIMKKYND
jgi:response regulator RpfG family c-di-GMP phosphodiesterase